MIICIGSLNIDYTYSVEHFVRPGECLLADSLRISNGGKAMNQAIALKRAGADMALGGKIGNDGVILKEQLVEAGVNIDRLLTCEQPTGHAIIQVNREGENCIVVYGGANQSFKEQEIDELLKGFGQNDILLIQNEINLMDYVIRSAKENNIRIAFNPAPFTEEVKKYCIENVDYLILNETEAEGLSGIKDPYLAILDLNKKYPNTTIIITLGEKGTICCADNQIISQNSFRTNAIDTVGAGDTFIGYFIHSVNSGSSIQEAMRLGCKAAAICVSKNGAAESIPSYDEVIKTPIAEV